MRGGEGGYSGRGTGDGGNVEGGIIGGDDNTEKDKESGGAVV